MSVSQLEHKTIRPGSLGGYSYYHSNRNTTGAAAEAGTNLHGRHWLRLGVVLLVIAAGYFGFTHLQGGSSYVAPQITSLPASNGGAAPSLSGNHCAGNSLDKFIKVSISQRHLWACQEGHTVQDASVITGMLAHASTLTPPGTYHIYGKTTHINLTGADESGSWDDPVDYWMPFLDNQHGTYGFHDANWRPADAFGKISPSDTNASHGCVELPLATSKWLYNWAPVGTTVSIQS